MKSKSGLASAVILKPSKPFKGTEKMPQSSVPSTEKISESVIPSIKKVPETKIEGTEAVPGGSKIADEAIEAATKAGKGGVDGMKVRAVLKAAKKVKELEGTSMISEELPDSYELKKGYFNSKKKK